MRTFDHPYIKIEVNAPDPVFDPMGYTIRTRVFDFGKVYGKNDILSENLIKYHGDRNSMIKDAMAKTAELLIRELEREENDPRNYYKKRSRP